MKLVLIRHGLAVSREEFQSTRKDDALRPLVNKGRERSAEAAKELSAWIEQTDILVTSPYLRAYQTARICQRVLKPKRFVEAVELIPSAPPTAFAQWLRLQAASATTIVVVGHEPQLDLFATWCLSGQLESFIRLKKSGMIGLEVENFQEIAPARAELHFLMGPMHMGL